VTNFLSHEYSAYLKTRRRLEKHRNLELIFHGTVVRTVYQPGITTYIWMLAGGLYRGYSSLVDENTCLNCSLYYFFESYLFLHISADVNIHS